MLPQSFRASSRRKSRSLRRWLTRSCRLTVASPEKSSGVYHKIDLPFIPLSGYRCLRGHPCRPALGGDPPCLRFHVGWCCLLHGCWWYRRRGLLSPRARPIRLKKSDFSCRRGPAPPPEFTPPATPPTLSPPHPPPTLL